MPKNKRNSSLYSVITQWIVLFFIIKGITCIRLVSLNVPARVKKGSEVQLSCLYDLGNASLYSLKWFYRNHKNPEEQEFFRYTPRGKPVKQVFPLEGINVDFYKSEGGTVYITETNGMTSGNYKCEISVEGTFQTVAAEKLMTVEANRASVLSHPAMDTNKLLLQLLCASSAILAWIASKQHLSQFFSADETSITSTSSLTITTTITTTQTQTTTNETTNTTETYNPLIDCRTQPKCHTIATNTSIHKSL